MAKRRHDNTINTVKTIVASETTQKGTATTATETAFMIQIISIYSLVDQLSPASRGSVPTDLSGGSSLLIIDNSVDWHDFLDLERSLLGAKIQKDSFLYCLIVTI